MTMSVQRRNGGTGPVRHDHILTFSVVGFPANRSAQRDWGSSNGTTVGCGQPCSAVFAVFDPATSSWKTYPSSGPGDGSYTATWPRAGMTCNGTAYRLAPSALPMRGTCGSHWPTPRAT